MAVAIVLVVVLVLLAGIGFWLATRRKAARDTHHGEDDETLHSVVLLMREPIYLDAAVLERIATEAWRKGRDREEEIKITALGPMPDAQPDKSPRGAHRQDAHFLILFRDFVFSVHVVPWPYVEDKQADADALPDLRKRLLFLEHEAWVSCDLMTIIEDGDPAAKQREAYRYMARLIAELIDDRALLVYLPEYGIMHAVGENTAAALRGEDPIEALKAADLLPMVSVDSDDEEIRAAKEEAQRRFDEFVRAFEARAGSQFSVKAPVRYDDRVEHIWIEVDAIEGGVIYGALANDPHDLGPLKVGDRVRVRVDEVEDWCYVDENDELVGGFTIPILAKRLKERRHQR